MAKATTKPGSHRSGSGDNPTSRAFHKVNRPIYGKVAGDAPAIRHIGTLEARSERIKQRLKDHYKKFEESWTAREAITLWQQQMKAPSQTGRSNLYDPAAVIMAEARQNVRARVIKRFSKINAIRTRMENAFLRSRPEIKQANDLAPAAKLSIKRRV
jgi:chemotaxis regulatin CheY-phosphate phosphatase CheZ